MTPHARAEVQGLLRRLAEGDRAAIEPTYAALWPLVRGFSARSLGDEGDAEDAAQETLLKVFSQASGFDPSRDAVAWVLTIAFYEVRTLRRRRHRRREVPAEAAEPTASKGDLEASVVSRDLQRAAREILAGMKEEDVSTILSAVGESRPTGDATFRKRLQRAVARLRDAWRAKHETP